MLAYLRYLDSFAKQGGTRLLLEAAGKLRSHFYFSSRTGR
jgi:hypothetical protein